MRPRHIALLFSATLLTACADPETPESAAPPAALSEAPAPGTPAHAGAIPGNTDSSASTAESPRYETTLDYFGIGFHVVARGEGSIGTVTITPTGLQGDNSPITRETDGPVELAEVGDLNVDGSPEIFVYTRSAGSGSYGGLIAYATNAKRSLSEIYLPPIADDPKASAGFMGHDEFRVVENTLVRRFPVYREGDTNAAPTGGTRQLQYKLEAGEAGWVLRTDKIVEY